MTFLSNSFIQFKKITYDLRPTSVWVQIPPWPVTNCVPVDNFFSFSETNLSNGAKCSGREGVQGIKRDKFISVGVHLPVLSNPGS